MSDLHKRDEAAGEGVYAVPTGAHVKDNEQVMSDLSTCSLLVVHPVVLPCLVVHRWHGSALPL